MIIGSFSDVTAVCRFCPDRLARAIEWARHNWSAMPQMVDGGNGRIVLEPDVIWANVETPQLRLASQAPLEVHRRFIDIHIPVSGPETIGCTPLHQLAQPSRQYDAERDIAFYRQPPLYRFSLKPGEFAVITPLYAHAPLIGTPGVTLRKTCIKVAL